MRNQYESDQGDAPATPRNDGRSARERREQNGKAEYVDSRPEPGKSGCEQGVKSARARCVEKDERERRPARDFRDPERRCVEARKLEVARVEAPLPDERDEAV